MDLNLEAIIQSSEIFSHLDKSKINELVKLMEIVKLNAGDTLFEKDSQSDSLYVVVKGMLAAILLTPLREEKIAGMIRSGQTVGEMGLLTSLPRGLTIRALRESVLLKLTREAFDNYFAHEPDILMKLVRFIVTRSQKTIRVLTSYYQYTNIMLLPSSDRIDLQAFVSRLKEQIRLDSKIIFLSVKDLKDNYQSNYTAIHKHLDQLEVTHQYILYVVDVYNEELLDMLFERTDRIVLLGKGNESVQTDPFVKKELETHYAKHIRKDLVLLYPEGVSPNNTGEWLARTHIARYHHIHINQTDGYASLSRFLMGEALGLVLGGGGVRGWVEVGVIKALFEKKVAIDIVGGTSIGATVGACFLMSSSYDEFFQTVNTISKAVSNPFAFRHFTFPLISILSGESGTLALQKCFGQQTIENLIKPFFCISCNISKYKQAVHTRGLLWHWVRASGAIPGLVPPIVDDGDIYVDGGVINNLPVDVMKDYLDGKGKIIAVDLSATLQTNQAYYFPPSITFWEAIKIKLQLGKNKHYKFPRYYETLIEALLMGSHERVLRNAMSADILIQPDLSKYSAFFQTNQIEQLISLGYQLMMYHLSPPVNR
ncbi:MAG TPA: cyclic nucleotide-binding and patatin-like phospholipase domain-containing protein [Gammaproteobacteria bacterium]|nr:cyclic nucleotide-binding and patatin-like phospholipase domain-containing protein [Gammaproteobacteria bacterium]